MLFGSEEVWTPKSGPRKGQVTAAPAATQEPAPVTWLKSPSRRYRLTRNLIIGAILAGSVIVVEARTSWLQSRLLKAAASRLTFSLESGPSHSVPSIQSGPQDLRFGYSGLPSFVGKLRDSGFTVAAQARSSPLLLWLAKTGFYPIYNEKTQAGLHIFDRADQAIFASPYPERIYGSFEQVPPLIVRTLLFIENREALDERYAHQNPAVEWDRLANAVVDLSLSKVVPGHPRSGGSTLATQIEKVRHSPGGRTDSVGDKLRQIGSASLRAYIDGPNTIEARKRIIQNYLNSIPLAAAAGYGEVNGLGDGLWAWYGADFNNVNLLLTEQGISASDDRFLEKRALAYRQVLSLLLALNRPSAYLRTDGQSLQVRVDAYLPLLAESGIISPRLRDVALRTPAPLLDRAPSQPQVAFAERKGTDAVRRELLTLLGMDSLYDLDRLDLNVETTLDGRAQEMVTRVLGQYRDPSHAAEAGLAAPQLLGSGDPAGVIYSFTLYERGNGANLLRVQADTYDQPLNMNEGTKLELGSTAKLRTLVSYLEIVAELHRRYSGVFPQELRSVPVAEGDRLTRWAIDYLLETDDRELPAMLEAAMSRRFSASPAEGFYTGGGLHRFSNFDSKDNGRVYTVRGAFQNSVNLVFIRLMREVVHYHMFRVSGDSPGVLEDVENPDRQEYLVRFADWEGQKYLRQFYSKYRGHGTDRALQELGEGIRKTPKRLSVIYRSVRPDEKPEALSAFLTANLPDFPLSDRLLEALYNDYGPEQFSLNDRAYLAGVHPLELWLLEYMHRTPDASLDQVLDASVDERQQVYRWLFKTAGKQAQDLRIRTILEMDAFEQIHRSWSRLGYPFSSLVPSYATAIGSSGDNPASLAELIGIILNDGTLSPMRRIGQLRFAQGTPLEAIVEQAPRDGKEVISPVVAALLRRELVGVVEQGTGRRAAGAIVLDDGTTVPTGGKTGTGDNRFETYDASGRVLDSRAINRTATFVFFIGDRFFGTVTAFVPGEKAGEYEFTSALPVQVFKNLVPAIRPLLEPTPAERLQAKANSPAKRKIL